MSVRRIAISLQNHDKRELPDIGYAASGRAAECSPLAALLPQSSGRDKEPSLAVEDQRASVVPLADAN